MRTLSRALILAILISCFSACSSLTSFEKPTLSIADLRPTKFARDGQVFTLKLKVDNPNGIALPIAGLNYALNLSGYDIAQGFSDNAVSIPANGTGFVEVDIKANLIEILPKLAKSLMSGDRSLSYDLKGQVNLNSRFVKTIPFDKKGELEFNPFDLMKIAL